ncbi:MAG: T9SS type A sorting domain-containing protein [Saprospiraceae bacterium]|nr:T9SS type A sorting domain-containing protein [Saprospiraceae bacterium]
MSIFKIISFFIFLSASVLHAQLHIRVTMIPENTPSGDKIYLAGNINNWNPGSNAHILQKDTTGVYTITLTPANGTINFKFTRGSWDKVEGTVQGTFIPNRAVVYNGQEKTENLTIAGWEDLGNPGSGSTASPQVSILSNSFWMPQLNRNRKIWLYLPPDYETSAKNYPVLYMHDGQNLFDNKTAFAGEWRVDESLDSLFLKGDHGCIVVGIENGHGQRLNEYSPWVNSQYGGGQGDEYVRFIVETLKPHIDSTYRTFPEADQTGVLGSSMGGLISVYGGVQYPQVFGRVGAFSSAFWFSPKSYEHVNTTGTNNETYFYMIAGNQESGNQTGDMQKMVTALKSSGSDDDRIKALAHPDGTHTERYWAREFPAAYKWLFEKKTSSTTSPSPISNELIKYNYPIVEFVSEENIENLRWMITDLMGKTIRSEHIMNGKQADISSLPSGIYLVCVYQKDVQIAVKKIMVGK